MQLNITFLGLWQCELLTTKFDTKMKMNYSYNEMKRAFECGRNFQLTGENNFQELIEELNQALPQSDVRRSALEWWENLSFRKQREYELKTFGVGEYLEDNDTLEPEDIIKMYQQHYA